MRVELKQWLRSHWDEMSANDRARFPEQILFLRPGGAGITSMREEYEHWLQILMMISAFVLLIVCANVANLMLVRGMERRRQISLSMALGAQASRLVRQALTESIWLSLAGGAAGLAIAFAGTRLILHFAFPHVGGLAGVPISASPSMPVLLFAFGVSLVTGVAFGIAPAWMATRVDPIEALRGASRSTARTGSLPRKTLVVFQAALSLVLLVSVGTAHGRSAPSRESRFRLRPGPAHHRAYRSTACRLSGRPAHDYFTGVSMIRYRAFLACRRWLSAVLTAERQRLGELAYGWMDIRLPDPMTTTVLSGIESRRDISTLSELLSSEGAASPSRIWRLHSTWRSSMRRLRGSFFRHEDPIGKHFGRYEMGASRQYEIVGIAQDARYLDFDLDKPVGPFFFLPEAQHDLLPNTGMDGNPGSHFLHDIVIVTRPGASLSSAQMRQAMASVDPNLPIISIQFSEGASGRTIPPAAPHCAAHLVLRSSFACPGFDWAVWSYCLQRRTPHQRDWRAYGARRQSRPGCCAGTPGRPRAGGHWVSSSACR